MANVGGRVREGKPPKLWSKLGHDFQTPATGAVDLDGFAAIPPTPWATTVSPGVLSRCAWPYEYVANNIEIVWGSAHTSVIIC